MKKLLGLSLVILGALSLPFATKAVAGDIPAIRKPQAVLQPVTDDANQKVVGRSSQGLLPHSLVFPNDETIVGTFISSPKRFVAARWNAKTGKLLQKIISSFDFDYTRELVHPDLVIDDSGNFVALRRYGEQGYTVPIYRLDWEKRVFNLESTLPRFWTVNDERGNTLGESAQMAFSPDSKLLLITTGQLYMHFWDWRNRKISSSVFDLGLFAQLDLDERPLFINNGSRVGILANFDRASASAQDRPVLVFDVAQGKKVYEIPNARTGEWYKEIALSKDGRICAVGSSFGHVKVFSLVDQDYKFVSQIGFTGATPIKFALDSTGKNLVYVTRDLKSGEEIIGMAEVVSNHLGRAEVTEVSLLEPEQPGKIEGIVFSPSGALFATHNRTYTARDDAKRSIKIWRTDYTKNGNP